MAERTSLQPPPTLHPTGKTVIRLVDHQGRCHHLLRRYIDMLAKSVQIARQQRNVRRQHTVHSGFVHRRKPAMLQRLAIRRAADRHDTAGGIGNDLAALILAVRPGLPEWRDRRHHQAGIVLLQRRMIQTKRRQIPRRKTLHDHVGAARQPAKHRGTLGLCQIEGDATFVEIGQQEEQALFRVRIVLEERRQASTALAAGWLDLNDVGTVITQQPRAERTRDSLAKIQHQQIVEYGRQHHHSSCWPPV